MKLYFRILKYIRPYRILVILSILSSFIFVAMNSLSVWMVGSVISTLFESSANMASDVMADTGSIKESLQSFTQYLIGKGESIDQLKRLCILMVIIFLIKNIFLYISRVVMSFIQNKLIGDIRDELFAHMQRLSIPFYDKNKTPLNDIYEMEKNFKNIDIFKDKINIDSKGSTIINLAVNPSEIIRHGDGIL